PGGRGGRQARSPRCARCRPPTRRARTAPRSASSSASAPKRSPATATTRQRGGGRSSVGSCEMCVHLFVVPAQAGTTAATIPVSLQRLDAGFRDLLVLVRLHAGDPDGTDALALVHDRQAALDEDASREAGEGRALLDAVLEELARPLGHRRGARLAERD